MTFGDRHPETLGPVGTKFMRTPDFNQHATIQQPQTQNLWPGKRLRGVKWRIPPKSAGAENGAFDNIRATAKVAVVCVLTISGSAYADEVRRTQRQKSPVFMRMFAIFTVSNADGIHGTLSN